MGTTLGDAFTLRKKLGAGIETWINRLNHAGRDHREYVCKQIEGESAFCPEPGTEKITHRHYTIEECREKLSQLIQQDREIAMRISLTNQKAIAEVQDLDGNIQKLTIPELLVLKNEIIPKMEQIARSMPTRPDGVNIFAEGEGYIKQRKLRKIEKRKETITEKGLKVEETEIVGYNISEITEYGVPQRQAWNEIDLIQDFAERVKQAINEANKTELIELS